MAKSYILLLQIAAEVREPGEEPVILEERPP